MLWLSQQLASANEMDSGGKHGIFKRSFTRNGSPGGATGSDRMEEGKWSPVTSNVMSDVDKGMMEILEHGEIYIREGLNIDISIGKRMEEEAREMDARANETGDRMKVVRRSHDVATKKGTVGLQERDANSGTTVTFIKCWLFFFFPFCFTTSITINNSSYFIFFLLG